jgi:hypothetical protein
VDNPALALPKFGEGIRIALFCLSFTVVDKVPDVLSDLIRSKEGVIVGNTDNGVAFRFDKLLAFGVVFDLGFVVAFTVNFDDKVRVEMGEIGDVGANRDLSADVDSLLAPFAELCPEEDLWFGHRFAQSFGIRFRFLGCRSAHTFSLS